MKVLAIGILLLALFSCQTTGGGQKPVVYLVKVGKGDTLNSIAMRFGTTWQAILRDNRISDYRQIVIGQVLRVRPGPGGHLARERDHSKISETEKKSNSGGLLFGNGSASNQKLMWPVAGTLTSKYGLRHGKPHTGIDIGAPRGTPIKAAHRGRVVFAGVKNGYGKVIILDHGESQTLYAHCHRIAVKKDQWVAQGYVIGTVGSTGNATGPHLHFEVLNRHGSPVDPLYALNQPDWLVAEQ